MTKTINFIELAKLPPDARQKLLDATKAIRPSTRTRSAPSSRPCGSAGTRRWSEFAKQFDGAPVPAAGIRVGEEEIERGCANVPVELAKAILSPATTSCATTRPSCPSR